MKALHVALCVAVVLGVLGVSVAVAESSMIYYACVRQKDGGMRMIGPGASCKRNEFLITWNQRGPQGPTGPTGPTGAQGSAGASGVGTYCGRLPEKHVGNIAYSTGTVRSECRLLSTCNSETAHMCSGEELYQSWVKGIVPPDGEPVWAHAASASQFPSGGETVHVDNCNAWVSPGANEWGTTFYENNGRPLVALSPCTFAQWVPCCD